MEMKNTENNETFATFAYQQHSVYTDGLLLLALLICFTFLTIITLTDINFTVMQPLTKFLIIFQINRLVKMSILHEKCPLLSPRTQDVIFILCD